jgi:RNA ligase
MTKHPARTMPYNQLYEGLERHVDERYLTARVHPHYSNLTIYNYASKCVHAGKWNEITTLARGLILDTEREQVVATPFPKFFNLGEKHAKYHADMPYQVYEKLDGSLIIIFYYDGQWMTATRGSFLSEQAVWAQDWVKGPEVRRALHPETTYLAEACYADNRIVIPYEKDQLVLLGAYDKDGNELLFSDLFIAERTVFSRTANSHGFESFAKMIEHAAALPYTEEGYVIRYENGDRLKLKGNEYVKIHHVISQLTPLGIWRVLKDRVNLSEICKLLPEEFLEDFTSIVNILLEQQDEIEIAVKKLHVSTAEKTDKEIGLAKDYIDPLIFAHIFHYRKDPANYFNEKGWHTVWRQLRPDENYLKGYVPSVKLKRVQEEVWS